MSEASTLLGATVDTIAFGHAHFQLRLSRHDDEFSVSSAADVSMENPEIEAKDFRTSKATCGLIDLIGAKLTAVEVDEFHHVAALKFGDRQVVRVWWPDKIYDNLFIVRRERSDECWVIG